MGKTWQKCWNALLQIPYGQTRTYLEQATTVGNPKACRAVGTANRNNRIALLIPCHRVINMSGSLGGFGGRPQLKRALLRHEGIFID
jgi:AraC family transcriptional regulator of adaptative response/methylated-DNA-[protein]-cysteine methyltransferase